MGPTKVEFPLQSGREERRLLECAARRVGSCGIIDMELGWRHGLSMDECDTCWNKGGPYSPEAQKYRLEYVQLGVSAAKKNLEKRPAHVVAALLLRHTPKNEQKELFLKVAPRFGEHIALLYAGELGLYEETVALFAAMSSQEKVMALDPSIRWDKVKEEWNAAEKWSLLGKAIASRVMEGAAPDPVVETRHISCFGTKLDGTYAGLPCPALAKDENGNHYCNDCGCGRRAIARLDGPGYTKLHYPTLSCPRRRPGFSNAD